MNLENISYSESVSGLSKGKSGDGLRMRNDVHIVRKLWHMGTGLIGLAFYVSSGLEQKTMAFALIGLALAAFMVEILRMRIEAVNNVVLKVMGPFMRESERNSVSGFPFYALGVGISLALFNEKIAILSTMFLVFGDPISSYFGITFGKEKILPNKSLQGAMAGFITCYLITFFFTYFFVGLSTSVVLFAILGGLLGMIGELASIVADDNLTIPIISGAGLSLLNTVFNFF